MLKALTGAPSLHLQSYIRQMSEQPQPGLHFWVLKIFLNQRPHKSSLKPMKRKPHLAESNPLHLLLLSQHASCNPLRSQTLVSEQGSIKYLAQAVSRLVLMSLAYGAKDQMTSCMGSLGPR